MEDSRRDTEHLDALERSRRHWDFWSSHWGFIEADTTAIREETISQVELERGDTVLDLGCGPGVNFEPLHEAVGPDGHIVAVDLSRQMLDRAQARIDDHGWENISLVQTDATRPVVADAHLDGAIATTAVSATPDVRNTVANTYDALRPGGRFAVYDIRLVPTGPATILNPVVQRFYRLFGNWNTDEDVWQELQSRFDTTQFVRSFALGTNYIAVAGKSEGARPPSSP